MSFNFGDAGGAVSDIFGAMGDMSEASAYGQAAKYATQNAQLEQTSTQIQEFQANRAITQSIGATQAATAGAGFTQGGSSGDILRSSAAQGGLTKNLISIQGQVNENGYLEQASQFKGMQSAAQAAAGGGLFGGLLKGIGAIASIAAI
jgi:hypothetical protein